MVKESKTDISVVIITKNEEENIGACILTCKRFSNDVIVVDSESTDQTVSIAKESGARVYVKKWQGYGPQKNYGNSLAMNDWVLSIDADEIPNDNLVVELKSKSLLNKYVYLIKLDDHFGRRKIKYSELRPKWKKRLFNRKYISWNNNSVHELLSIPKEIKHKKLKGRILHFSYGSIDDFEKKILYYASLGAKSMANNGVSLSRFKKLINPNFRFFRSYILYGGFLEGKLGYQISKILKDGLIHKYKLYSEFKTN